MNRRSRLLCSSQLSAVCRHRSRLVKMPAKRRSLSRSMVLFVSSRITRNAPKFIKRRRSRKKTTARASPIFALLRVVSANLRPIIEASSSTLLHSSILRHSNSNRNNNNCSNTSSSRERNPSLPIYQQVRPNPRSHRPWFHTRPRASKRTIS